ncbi:MAG: hypothetical protein Q7R51_03110 [bacterium]|nr:hypothetical protein [bacterium]
MEDNNNFYKIGLPSNVRIRSQIIFGVLLFLFLSLSVSSVYAGVKTGRFRKVLIEPLSALVKSLEARVNSPSTEVQYPSFNATSSSNVDSEVNSQAGNYQAPNNSYAAPYVYPTIVYKSYDEIKKEQDAWWAQAQEQTQKLSEDSKNSLEQFRLDSQKKMDEFKKEGQQGMEQFQLESEQKMEEFKQKYGF